MRRWAPPALVCALALAACARIPPVCEAMCEAATAVRAECLETDGEDWSDHGFDDADDHLAWCETWVWARRVVERRVGGRGETVGLCIEREASLPDMSCEDYAALSW